MVYIYIYIYIRNTNKPVINAISVSLVMVTPLRNTPTHLILLWPGNLHCRTVTLLAASHIPTDLGVYVISVT